MYVVVKDNKIIDAFDHFSYDKARIQASYPGCEVLETDLYYGESVLLSLARLYNKQVVLKPTVRFQLDKSFIKADGDEEIRLAVQLVCCQPGEFFESIKLDIDGASVTVALNENQGQVILSTKVRGLHRIKVADDRFVWMETGFDAN
jgi:hypothetical protein